MSKTNVEAWNELQRGGYFRNHPYYRGHGTRIFGDLERIAAVFALKPEHRIAVIGSGYGREAAALARKVEAVYCLDVPGAMPELEGYMEEQGIANFYPVPYKPGWEFQVPAVDFVYSFNVFQHLTRAIADDYLANFAWKLKPGGGMLVQFCQMRKGGLKDVDTAKIAEQTVSWSIGDIYDAAKRAGLEADQVTEEEVNPDGTPRRDPGLGNYIWHWAFFKRGKE